MRSGGQGQARAVAMVLIGAMALVGCSDSDGSLVDPASAGRTDMTAVSSSGSAETTAGTAPESRTDTEPADGSSTTGSTAAATTTTTIVRTPTAIEATLVDPATAWPASAGAPPVDTTLTLADGTDNELLPSIYRPVLAPVPHATIAVQGGAIVERVTGYEFPDAASADAWVATWAGYQGDDVADLPLGVHVERHPLPTSPPGWSGYVLDAVYARDASTPWQRTATAVRASGLRAYTVSVRWFGDSAAGVPDLTADLAALAGAQDAFLANEGIGATTPGTGTTDLLARLALTERAAPWASLLAQPDINPNAGVQVLQADTPDTIPAGAAGASAIAARVACGDRGCPLFSVVTRFPDAAGASAAAARWSQADALLGPLDEVAFAAAAAAPPPGSTGITLADVVLVDASALSGASALTATLSDGVTSYQVGAGWFARGDTVYGVLTVYPSSTRNAEVVAAVLADHTARLAALGIS